jgi:D-alanyl-D-alanine carboxypeptidase
MKKLLLSLLLCIGLLSSASAQITPTIDARLQFILDSVCTVHRIKGASAAVLLPNAGIWKGVHGVSTDSQPMTSDMMLGLGSNTKTYISTLMLKLQENGLVDLDDTIGTWMQGNPYINGQITIRQLLNHTSGIYSYTSNPNFNNDIISDFTAYWPPEKMLDYIDAPLFNPGTNWSYSNSNYLIAGLILKAILAEPISISIRSMILQPQNLNNTYLFPEEAPVGPMANIWTINFMQPYLEDIITEYDYNHNAVMSSAWAAGGMIATAEDNVLFWSKLMNGQIINSSSLQQMKTFRQISGTKAYGLGVFRTKFFNGRTVYGHGGTNLGYINENIFDSINGACISAMTNQDSISNSIILSRIVGALHRAVIANPLAVQSDATTANVEVFPNPVHDHLTIRVADGENIAVEMYDALGKKVFTVQRSDSEIIIPVNDLSPGVYMLHVFDESHSTRTVRKIVVE